MSNKSNDNGRAFEYICINKLYEEIKKYHKAEIHKNSSIKACEKSWNKINSVLQENLKQSASAMVKTLFECEPLLIEIENLLLEIQPDEKGQEGDVRDIIITNNSKWEIGLSLKHNHFAVKHSRLSKNIDFGEKWLNIKCSYNYWENVKKIFNFLETEKKNKTKWSELQNKEKDIYEPLLEAFKSELLLINKKNKNITKELVKYLLGKYDFYKVISVDAKKQNEIHCFNLSGTLNQYNNNKPIIIVPKNKYPSKILHFDFLPNKNNTLVLCLDNGWQFTFRIHNASKYVEPSLKFDIQIVGMPSNILVIKTNW